MADTSGDTTPTVTEAELKELMKLAKHTCEVVRLVDPSTFEAHNYDIAEDCLQHPYSCFSALDKSRRCNDCISARAVTQRSQATKFEFVGDEAYFITARYLEVDGEPRSLEMVQKITDNVGLASGGVTDFAQRITRTTDASMTDEATGAYSRTYLDSGLRTLTAHKIALIRILNLAQINDEHGYSMGDTVLRTVAQIINGQVRPTDTLIRYNQDTFALQFEHLPSSIYEQRLHDVWEHIIKTSFTGLPGFHPQVVIGAVDGTASFEELVESAEHELQRASLPDNPLVILSEPGSVDEQDIPEAPREGRLGSKVTTTDELTGLMGRIAFWKELQGIIDDETAWPTHTLLIQFDIEDFKSYNRNFGFAEGDALIKYVADELRTTFEGDLIGRLQADRFGVVTSRDAIEAHIQQLHDRIASYQPHERVRLKAGIFELDGQVRDATIACDRAKVACDSIKGLFDKVWRRYDMQLDNEITMSRYIIGGLDSALENGYITVFYQPIVRAATGRICDHEALVRWNDPTWGFLSPMLFVPTLERTHLIHKLDRYVLDVVCADLAQRMHEGKNLLPASVNLSRIDFQLCDVFELVEEAVHAHGIDRQLLHLEVTESAIMSDANNLHTQVARLRAAGYEVWMDDFGSGYSSLNLLKDFRFDVLKIDMAFLQGIEHNRKAREIIVSVVDMAKRLGIKTLAEGVETQQQCAFLRRIGCEMLQGYYFGRPAPIDDEQNTSLAVEDYGDRAYYESVGCVNLLGFAPATRKTSSKAEFVYPTEQETRTAPLAIVEHQQDGFSYLSANEEYLSIAAEFTDLLDGGYELVGGSSSAVLQALESHLAKDGAAHDVFHTSCLLANGREYQLLVLHIASRRNADAYLIELES